MDDALMVRSGERQRLLETLKQMVLECEDGQERFRSFLVLECLARLEKKQVDTPVDWFFTLEVAPLISEFARSDKERLAIISDLLVWVVGSIAQRFSNDLAIEEFDGPESIFRALSTS
jgi:hypothetical protein